MPHLRRGDIKKLAKPSRAIQAGSRVLVFRYGHQPGKQKDNTVSRILPQIQTDNDPERPGRFQPFLYGNTHQQQNPVDNPHLIKQQFRQKHCPNDRHNIGKQKHRLQQHMFLCLLFQQKRDQVRHQQDQRKPCQQKTERIPAGKAEHLILHHLQIIGKPDKNTAPPGAAPERIPQNHQKRNRIEHQAPDHQRCHQQPSIPVSLPFLFHRHPPCYSDSCISIRSYARLTKSFLAASSGCGPDAFK